MEQRSFEIQEIQINNSPKESDTSMEKDRKEKNLTSVPYDLFLSSMNSIQGQIFDGTTEVILLEPEVVRNHSEVSRAVANCRVIELSHSDSKMILQQQFGEKAEYGSSNSQNNIADYDSMDILRKLPPDTVVIRQEAKRNKEINDYKELMQTNSGESNSTSGYAAAKAKRIPRVVRNKTLAILIIY